MPFNLLIFPLAGGYYILANCIFYKYTFQRAEGEKLVLKSIITGIILILVTFIFRGLFEFFFPKPIIFLYQHFPIHFPYLGTTLMSFVFAVIYTKVVNYIGFDISELYVRRAIQQEGTELEILLMNIYVNRNFVQITLNNDKVYIGFVHTLPMPRRALYVVLIPVYSGFRDSNTKKLNITTNYFSVYESYVADETISNTSELNVMLTINISEILTASIFDIDMYNRFKSIEVANKVETSSGQNEPAA